MDKIPPRPPFAKGGIIAKEQGFVLVAGALVLALAGWLTLSGWSVTQLSVKTATNYQQRLLAKEAAFVELRACEEKLNGFLDNLDNSNTAAPVFAVDNALLAEKIKPHCCAVKYLGRDGTEQEPGPFYFQITAIGRSKKGASHQRLSAYYSFFKQVGLNKIQGVRNALYLF